MHIRIEVGWEATLQFKDGDELVNLSRDRYHRDVTEHTQPPLH